MGSDRRVLVDLSGEGKTAPMGRASEGSPDTLREPTHGLPGIGEIVAGRYRVERLLGSGGMGHVLLARQDDLRRRVALKFLDPSLLDDPQSLERFAREARAMAALTSPHTVRVHDVGALPSGLPYFVMDYLEGHDLAHELLSWTKPIPAATACDWIMQACRAVEEAHAAGLIHRDLKPQNLFLTELEGRDHVRVVDFGIARAVGGARIEKLSTLTRVGDVIGTISYMAPEQLRSAKSVDKGTDIWSLGACLYRFLSRGTPFDADTEPALIEAILLAPPTPLRDRRPDVSPEIERVVMRCLEKASSDRYPTAGALRAALEVALEDRPRADRTEPLAPPLLRAPPVVAPIVPPSPLIPVAAPAFSPSASTVIPRSPPSRRGTSPLVIAAIVIAVLVFFGVGGALFFVLGVGR